MLIFKRFRSAQANVKNYKSNGDISNFNGKPNNKNAYINVPKNDSKVPLTKINSMEDFKELPFVKEYINLNPKMEINLNYDDIKKVSNKKFYNSYIKPSSAWYSEIRNTPKDPKHSDEGDYDIDEFGKNFNVPISKSFNLKIKEFNDFIIDTDNKCEMYKCSSHKMTHFMVDWLSHSINEPLKIGDVCILSSQDNIQHTGELSTLYTVIELPNDLKDSRYTFACIDGSIVFEYKNNVLLKIPSILKTIGENNGGKVEQTKFYSIIKNTTETDGDDDRPAYYKNDIINKYSIPVMSRQMILSYLPNFYLKCLKQISSVVERQLNEIYIEYCNNSTTATQDSTITSGNNSNVFETPFQVSFFDIVKKVQKKIIPDYKQSDNKNVLSIAVILSVFQNLYKNKKHLFGEFQFDKSSLVPISVTFVPIEYSKRQNKNLMEIMNNKKLTDDFVRDAQTGEIFNQETVKYSHILDVLNDYISGNLTDEYSLNVVSTICTPLLPKITKDAIHALLLRINPTDNTVLNKNPLLQNNNLDIYSKSSQLQAFFYNSITQSNIKALETLSVDENLIEFDDPVYCIDNATAHEIDDGIALKHLSGDKHTLYIHIAHPTRFLIDSDGNKTTNKNSPSSTQIKTMFEVAKRKSFTTYAPDITVPMLPEVFVKKHDLRNDTARSLCFQIDVELTKDSLVLDHKSFKIIDNYRLTNLPKKIHYSTVNELLSPQGNYDKSLEKHKNTLQKIFQISKFLKKQRKMDGAIIFGDGFNKGLVRINPETGKSEFYDGEGSDSTLLVSEIMILANSLCGDFLAKNKIPAIYKSYTHLKLDENLNLDLHKQNYADLDFKDLTMFAHFFNSSTYTLNYDKGQQIMAVPHYATVTSPLRRFPDIVNHLQILTFIKNKGKLFYSFDELSKILFNNILPRFLSIKGETNKICKYFTLCHVRDSHLQKTHNNEKKKFPITITAMPRNNVVKFASQDYKFASGTVHLKKGQFLQTGDSVDDCTITKVDALGGILEVEIDNDQYKEATENKEK